VSATPADLAELARNRRVLERLEEAAEALLASGADEDAAVAALYAGRIAWSNHPGRFASPRLEAVCAAIGRRLDAPPPAPPAPAEGRPERVLHVVTEAYRFGGHTRILRRWARLDGAREHRVVLTDSVNDPADALGADAGGLEVLASLTPGTPLLRRAAELRAAAAWADLIVLHVHPYDVIGLIAFPVGMARPPIVFSNHADHCFWLGRSVADVATDHRPAGAAIAAERRGVDPARLVALPLPPEPAPDPAEVAAHRARTRAKLGLGERDVLVLTIGAPYKYAAEGRDHLLDLVAPVLRRAGHAQLVAFGPEEEGPWRSAAHRTGGRVRALGFAAPLDPVYAAADVYLESYPCSGATCLRDAAAAGLPVLSYAPDPVEAEVLGTAPSPAFRRAGTAAEYATALEKLLRSPAERAEWGARARAHVEEEAATWGERLEAVYAAARAAAPVGEVPGLRPDEPAEPTPRDLEVLRLHSRADTLYDPAHAERLTAQIALAARSPAVRARFGRLLGPGGRPELRQPARLAVAAPPLAAEALAALVEELEAMVAAGLVEGGAVAVAPSGVDAAAAALGPLADARPGLALDLVVTDSPTALLGPDRIVVRQPGDGWEAVLPPGAAAGHHHVAARALPSAA